MGGITIQLDRRALLEFMDQVPEDARGQHTAIASFLGEPLAVALILHHLSQQGDQARCVTTKVTTGKKKSPWLDAWITPDAEARHLLYQTEIKMWAGRAFNGLSLPVDADAQTVIAAGRKQWEVVWDAEQQTFKARSVCKVLIPMVKPKGYEHARVEPLACFWWVVQPPKVSPTEELQPWFTVGTSSPNFPQVHIFSLSAYLRSLRGDVLSLPMPLVTARLALLQRLLPAPSWGGPP